MLHEMGGIGLPLGRLSGIMSKVAIVERVFPFGSGACPG